MQQAHAAGREEQRIMQRTRKRERETQRGQREVSALVVDAANTAEVVDEQEVAPRARGCCSAALQRTLQNQVALAARPDTGAYQYKSDVLATLYGLQVGILVTTTNVVNVASAESAHELRSLVHKSCLGHLRTQLCQASGRWL
jgi:hypothetical protein